MGSRKGHRDRESDEALVNAAEMSAHPNGAIDHIWGRIQKRICVGEGFCTV